MRGYPKSQDGIVTTGVMTITVGFAAAKEWDPLTQPAVDKAKPVLVEAELKIGSEDGVPDTLVVTYSESLSDAAVGFDTPVIIRTSLGDLFPTLGKPADGSQIENVKGTNFVRVTYVVIDGMGEGATFPSIGDSVLINYEIKRVEDNATVVNVQDELNRRVALKITRGDIKWDLRVKNNPFGGGVREKTTVSLSPQVKGATVEMTYKVRLYDNMGNMVRDEPWVTANNVIEWEWDGYNKSGRLSGTGTYLFLVDCTAKVLGSDGKTVEKKANPKTAGKDRVSIGFVR
jgi:hypothetical protein